MIICLYTQLGFHRDASYIYAYTHKHWKAVMMNSKKSVANLPETLYSLLGLKAHLTSNWIQSVRDILKTLPSETSTYPETKSEFDASNDDPDFAIPRIKDQLGALATQIQQLNIQRRGVLNEILDLKGNIRVFCRIRPMTFDEKCGHLRPVLALDSHTVLLKFGESKSKSYSLDKVFHPGSSQAEVFSEVEPVIKSVLDGYNACIFAHGQTGTGKTFTMEGSLHASGVVPRAIETLLRRTAESTHSFTIRFSMLEIYMGNLRDLLVSKPTNVTDPMPNCLSIQADPDGGIEIDNLVAIQVNDLNQALKLYRLGCRFRSTASTNSNITSSRSHCMIRIAITCFSAPERRRKNNKIWLVDLGGSERLLKTKAHGKRLEEGKAINLSLSALGDVISALQSKKRHIPYRNSKLTQVLKDSLGDDSKTLMLVHISPKEEDLCETICSLNFATRVKSIHLGDEDVTDDGKQKEDAIMKLQQKMKQIEEEQVCVRRDIEELKKKLKDLTGTSLSLEEPVEAHRLCEEPVPDNWIGDMKADTLKLPRFMRPTVCSQRKSGITYQTSEGKDQDLSKRNKASSHYAGSVNFPVKDNSECTLECSISRSSCLAGLGIRDSDDNATEYSQGTSEFDSRMINLEEQKRVPDSSVTTDFIHFEKNGSFQTNTKSNKKISKVNNWLRLQYGDYNVSGTTHRSKRVIAIPIPEKKHVFNKQKKTENFSGESRFRKKNDVNQNNEDKCELTRRVQRPKSEAAIDKRLTSLRDLFNKAERSETAPLYHTNAVKTMFQTEDSVDSSLTEENEVRENSPQDVFCCRLAEYKDDRTTEMSIIQAPEGEIHPGAFELQNCGCCQSSSSDLDHSSSYSNADSSMSISVLEVESCCQQATTKENKEDGEWKNYDAFSKPWAEQKGANLLQLKSQRALNLNSYQKNLGMPVDTLYRETKTRGISYILKQKIEILCASTLLGLGFYDLGFEHEFYYGLML